MKAQSKTVALFLFLEGWRDKILKEPEKFLANEELDRLWGTSCELVLACNAHRTPDARSGRRRPAETYRPASGCLCRHRRTLNELLLIVIVIP